MTKDPESKATSTYPAKFKPNFHHTYTVTLQQPLSTVFPILGTNAGLEKTIMVSSIASNFSMGKLDAVAVDGKVEDASVRTQEGVEMVTEGGEEEEEEEDTEKQTRFPRQGFSYTETVGIIPGLHFTDVVVKLEGTFTWDEKAGVSLYETTSNSNVTVRKTRIFTESDGQTTVAERIDGQCGAWLQPIVQRATASSHKQHMDHYHTLFK
ncbi:hypothetical protein HMN09_00902300 [Mycena chlorophos]|uniref:Uncharacterized protein n=1 Tax=Mycena chlorophos TaxID=658473 RepID=A0A8H6SPS0_MYCCL|nr:hypothetical protein HMN09_00902300 [Mycena chlorophos]